MKQAGFLVLFMGLWLVACQPVEVLVEVTRLTTNTPGTPSAIPATATPEIIEVTRLVPQEITRVVSETVTVEVTKAPLGSAARPVQLLFPPTFNSTVIMNRSNVLLDALQAATDTQYEIGVLDSEQAVVDLMCAAPTDTIGFLSAMGYVLAHKQCGVQAATVAIHHDELVWQTGMIVTRRDSGIRELADLADRSWAVPDMNSLPNFLYFQALLLDSGIATGELMPVPGDNSAMLAVYNGDADFATATYIPPILPFAEREWVYGEDAPELWRVLGVSPTRSPIGYVLVLGEPEYGGYRLRDARSGIFDAEPGIYDQTQVITLSAQIPNEVVALGADFPLGLARDVMTALTTFAASDACANSLCADDFYGWIGLQPADDAAYAPLRFVIETLGLTDTEIWTLAGSS